MRACCLLRLQMLPEAFMVASVQLRCNMKHPGLHLWDSIGSFSSELMALLIHLLRSMALLSQLPGAVFII